MFLNRIFCVILTLTWLLFPIPCLASAATLKPTNMFTAANAHKPGCQPTCGNITVPYPFGIGRHCAMSDDFVINCTTVNGKIWPIYVDNETAILEMSETQLTMNTFPLGASCGAAGNQWGELHAVGKPYAVSNTANVFMVVGCHHYGLLKVRTRSGRKIISCVALCTEPGDLLDDTCSGLGCCQAPLPKGLQEMESSVELINYNTSVVTGNCSVSFLAKRSSINFKQASELLEPDFLSKVSISMIVTDWFIPNATCTKAQRNLGSYACHQNTTCIDLDQELDVYGYRCKCLEGFEGNPYLTPGCSDIDECRPSSNPCSHGCINTPGRFKCFCPSGFGGDGMKNGTGCYLKSLKYALSLGLGMGLGTVVFIFGGYWFFIMARRKKVIMQRANNFKKNGGLLLKQQMTSKEGMIDKTTIFTIDELDKATDHFNEDRVLGKGGQGTVYKGMLSDGNIVAIKKSTKVDVTQLSDFINEVVILSQINHRNIVKLLGCCLETEIPLLIYEFVPNGTLCKCIHDPNEDFPITWEMRLQIAVDIAGALNYLHSASSSPIFHRDIKSSNILLDAKYRAKLSDFGTSRTVAVDQTHLTTRVQGTFGYLDPEYFRSHQYTEKSDVYGFGVVLVELLTGLKAILPSQAYNGEGLVSWFLSAMENSDLFNILYIRVAKEATKEATLHVADIAKRCLNMGGKERPTMREVLVELEMISRVHYVPLSGQRMLPEVRAQTSEDITASTSNCLLPSNPSWTEDNNSLPLNRSTNSFVQE